MDHGFLTKGEIVAINGDSIFVYEFADEATAKAEAAAVSPSGYTLTRSEGASTLLTHWEWIGTPHFYRKGRVIVIYVGDNLPLIQALETVLGPQFAGG